ncbi:MAG: S-layer homology domain-containing protein [Leptolyngbyaceae cyanobacterium SM2_5_2]|nr:S-layer homology domain-containing protein [Leptolyngbyaceae cyanobacterium SM2_5_2]
MLTRAELAALLDRAFSDKPTAQPPLNFSDVPDTYWAADAIDRAVATGFMSGYPDNTFAPDRSVPRYEVLVAIATGLKLSPSTTADATLQSFVDSGNMPAWSRSKVAATAEQGLIVNHPSRDQLRPNQAATRAEIVAFLHQALVSQGKLPPVNSEFAVPAL